MKDHDHAGKMCSKREMDKAWDGPTQSGREMHRVERDAVSGGKKRPPKAEEAHEFKRDAAGKGPANG